MEQKGVHVYIFSGNSCSWALSCSVGQLCLWDLKHQISLHPSRVYCLCILLFSTVLRVLGSYMHKTNRLYFVCVSRFKTWLWGANRPQPLMPSSKALLRRRLCQETPRLQAYHRPQVQARLWQWLQPLLAAWASLSTWAKGQQAVMVSPGVWLQVVGARILQHWARQPLQVLLAAANGKEQEWFSHYQ